MEPFIACCWRWCWSRSTAKLTRGRYYLARPSLMSGPASGATDLAATHAFTVCGDDNELPDVVGYAHHGAARCSRCCTLETGGAHLPARGHRAGTADPHREAVGVT
jgi:hypothetical protein